MTAIYMAGFDVYGTGVTGNSNLLESSWVEIQSNGSLGVIDTPAWGARTGTVSMTCINASSGYNRYALSSPVSDLFLSFGYSLGALPTGNFQSQICSFRDYTNTDIARLWCQSDGSIVLTDTSDNVLATSTTSLIVEPSVWYFIELNFNQSAGQFTLRLNDAFGNLTPAIQVTGLSFGSNPVTMLTFVACARQQVDWIDDLFIRDSTGSVNNSWLGVLSIGTLTTTKSSALYSIAQPPSTTTLIDAIQVTYNAYGSSIELVTPGGLLIETPGGLTIGGSLSSIGSAFVGSLGGTTTDVPSTLSSSPHYYNDIYQTDPDTGAPISPLSLINGMINIISSENANVTSVYVLIAYSSGIVSTQSLPAWTFVLDGHRFYVLSLGEQGDWAFDFTTKEWCQLQSQGFPGLSIGHGTMWGLRIVAGDILYPYLYEIDPEEPLDEGWREVEHMVTGGIPTRGRSVIGVANFTVTASVGLDSEDNAPISLAFSDDNGVTWSQEFDEPLTDMSTQSLIWNALGSFAAPGRIFRITDYSGPIRLDGADVVLTIGSGADSGQDQEGQQRH